MVCGLKLILSYTVGFGFVRVQTLNHRTPTDIGRQLTRIMHSTSQSLISAVPSQGNARVIARGWVFFYLHRDCTSH